MSCVQHVEKSLCMAMTCSHLYKDICKETGRAQAGTANPQSSVSREDVPGMAIGPRWCCHFPYAGCTSKIIYAAACGGFLVSL